MNMIFMDTETTSLLAVEAADLQHQPYIVEIFAIKTDEFFDQIATYHALVKPPIKIPDDVIKIHGIDNEMVKNEKPFAAHYKTLANFFLGVTYLIGHNLQYDKRMFINELQRINKQYNFPWPPKDICTVEEIQKIKGHRMSLGDLHEELFTYRFDNAHRAEDDTRALVRVFKEMVRRQWTKGATA